MQLAREAAKKSDRTFSADELAQDDVLWTAAKSATGQVTELFTHGIVPVVGVLTNRVPGGYTAEEAYASVIKEAISMFHRAESNYTLDKRYSESELLELGFEFRVVALSGNAEVIGKLEDMMQIIFMADLARP